MGDAAEYPGGSDRGSVLSRSRPFPRESVNVAADAVLIGAVRAPEPAAAPNGNRPRGWGGPGLLARRSAGFPCIVASHRSGAPSSHFPQRGLP